MAAKRTIKILAVLVLIVAGAMAIVIVRTRLLSISQKDESRFISTYMGLSIANSRYSNNPDSLKIARDETYRINSADSAWVVNYSKGLSKDLAKSARIWDEIIIKIDSLRAVPPEPDTVSMF
jgi:hypothetical protein